MTELVLTAYDITHYLSEALPALKAAVYRGNLAPAKEVLAVFEETIYEEWDLTQLLGIDDYSWIFTEDAEHPEEMDPEGDLVGLTYPLILAYHHPEIFRMIIGGSEFHDALPFLTNFATGLPNIPGSEGLVHPGFQEGLRAMWEIIGYLTPKDTETLHQYCLQTAADVSPLLGRMLMRLANGLQIVIQRGYGLVVERD